jgi:twitching motility protein PilT
MNDLLHAAVDSGASDILLAAGAPPMFRIAGELQAADMLAAMTPKSLEQVCRQILSEKQVTQLEKERDVDFSVSIPSLGRFRFNIHMQRGSYAAAIRFIPPEVPSLENLDLPPAVTEFTRLEQGLVLVTGQTGSGKTTTLAALVNHINQRDAKHIITLEDPVEYQYTHARALVEQREIGADCPSFASGLKHVLRQDPDVILVGELRDLETIRTALQAAETGHLVFATLHTSTAAGTIDRIVEVFPAEEQGQIRTHLAECLQGVVTQRLLPAAEPGQRVVAAEILVVNRAVQTSIREATAHLIPGIISTNRRIGMQTMEQAVKELVLNGVLLPDVAEQQLTELEMTTASLL